MHMSKSRHVFENTECVLYILKPIWQSNINFLTQEKTPELKPYH